MNFSETKLTKLQDKNIFDNPEKHLKEILNNIKIPKEKMKIFSGKTMAFVFLTKFCDAGCAHCFFRSGKQKYKSPQEQYEYSDEGLEKLIEFLNKSNNGYLAILGGGEPFKKYEYILEIIKRVKSDRIVLATSGNWAQNYQNAEKIVLEIYQALKDRNDNTKVILRLSIDKWHQKVLGTELIFNLINIFKNKLKGNKKIELQFHLLTKDDTIDKIIEKFKLCEMLVYKEEYVSDNKQIYKRSYNRGKIIIDNEYDIEFGRAQTFYPNVKVNLNKKNEITKKATEVFEKDMQYGLSDRPALVMNKGNELGLDFLISYNGNVATWCNEQIYDLNNLYVDDYEQIIKKTYENIISYSFLDKGYKYRKNIINEVNKKAVLRTILMNIRDYSGATILEEEKTRLYYAIRVVQDYLLEGVLEKTNICNISEQLKKNILNNDKSAIIKLYNNSDYCIIDEYKKRPFIKEEWKDLFTLINLGHYDIMKYKKKEGMKFYCNNSGEELEPISGNLLEEYQRLSERLTFMKPEAKEKCKNKSLCRIGEKY